MRREGGGPAVHQAPLSHGGDSLQLGQIHRTFRQFQFTQHQAVGTSLAVMIPPVTLPAVIEFYRKGHVDLRIAMWIALGFVGGAFLGGFIANKMNDIILRLVFGFILVYVGGYTLFQTFGKQHLVRSIIIAGVLTLVAAGTYAAIRAIDARQTPANTIL